MPPHRLPHSLRNTFKAVLALLLFLSTLSASAGARAAATQPGDPTPTPDRSPRIQQYPNWQAPPVPTLLPGSVERTAELPPGDSDQAALNQMASALSITYDNFDWDCRCYQVWNISSGYGYRLMTQTRSDNYYPRLSRDTAWIVFVSERDGNSEIYKMTGDGEAQTRLTSHESTDTMPAFSPDGSKIVFVSDRSRNADIYVMNSDGTGLTRLTYDSRTDVDPNWSPDGSSIIWVRRQSDGWGTVMTMRPDGSNPAPLLPKLAYPARPTYSPSGNRIGVQADINNDGWYDLVEFTSDGKNSRVFPIEKLGYADYIMGGWTPDEKNLIFSQVLYEVYNGRLYISSGQLWQHSIENGASQIYYNYTGWYAMDPDVAGHEDPVPPMVPPVSRLEPLPEYSPIGGFKVNFSVELSSTDDVLYGIQPEYSLDHIGIWNPIAWPSAINYTQTGASIHGWFSFYGGKPGDIVHFRIRATSQNGYEEPHYQADATTRLYGWQYNGRTLDTRTEPLAGAVIQAIPAGMKQVDSDIEGNGMIRFLASDTQTVTFAHPAFGKTPAQEWPGPDQGGYLAVMPPKSSWIQNGHFEDANLLTNGWNRSGDLPVLPIAGHSGWGAVRLAGGCDSPPCLNEPPTFSLTQGHSSVNIQQDQQGRFHMIYRDWDGKWFYRFQNAGGSWSEPEQLPFFGSSNNWYEALLVIDSTGRVHAIFPEREFEIKHAIRGPDSQWRLNAVIANNNVHNTVLADSAGNIHLISLERYSSYSTRVWIWNETRGWSEPYPLFSSSGDQILSTAEKDGIVFLLVGTTYGSQVTIYTYRAEDPSKMTQENIPVTGDLKAFLIGPNGLRYLIGAFEGKFVFATSRPGEAWSEFKPVGLWTQKETDIFLQALLDQAGRLHILSLADQTNTMKHWTLEAGEKTFQVETIQIPRISHETRVKLQENGKLLLITPIDSGFELHEIATASTSSEVRLEQAVAIPAGSRYPTLSFLYRQQLPGSAGGETGLTVQVIPPEGDPVTVPVNTNQYGWRHAWADLSAWVGQTVTVRFQFRQDAGAPYGWADLDEVTLGEWITPVVRSASPAQISYPYNPAAWVTLNGDNLQADTQVWVNGQPVQTGYQDGILKIQLPAGLKPGRYDILVTNPDGASSTRRGALQLGQELLLPALMR